MIVVVAAAVLFPEPSDEGDGGSVAMKLDIASMRIYFDNLGSIFGRGIVVSILAICNGSPVLSRARGSNAFGTPRD